MSDVSSGYMNIYAALGMRETRAMLIKRGWWWCYRM